MLPLMASTMPKRTGVRQTLRRPSRWVTRSIEPAGGAPNASEAAGQTAAAEEVAKLLLHEAREALALAQRRRCRAEGLEVVSDDPVQDGGPGIARRVGGR